MTQIDARYDHDEQAVLRRVLHTIATTPQPFDCVPPLLDATLTLTGAQGVAFVLFEDPDYVAVQDIQEAHLPDKAFMQAVMAQLGEGVHVNPQLPDGQSVAKSLIAGVIPSAKKPVGLLWVIFDHAVELTSPQTRALETLLDGFAVVATSIRSITRQKKLSRNQSEFMRIVSHDLRSPLTAMHGFASMLGMVGELTEKQDYFVEKIFSGITQMTSIVENFQDAGRFDPETGFYEMERIPCDVTDIVRRILSNHLVPAEKQELTLTADMDGDIPIVNADSNMIERAITNLVDNAIKYTPNGQQVEVGVKRIDDDLIISVADTGLGISKDNQKMLFERHVRIHRREHKKVKGSGLGLFIVRSVAQRHGGRAWVESEEGDGTTFYFSIPLGGENSFIPGASAT